MNKITKLLVALFVVSTSGFASTVSNPACLPQKTSSVISVRIDLGDITNLNQCEIAALIDKNLEAAIPDTPKLQCSVTVGASFSVGIAKFTISVTVSGDCSEVYADGNEIANRLIAKIKTHLINNF